MSHVSAFENHEPIRHISNERPERDGEEYFLDLLKNRGVKSAYCYINIDPAADRLYLAIVLVADVDTFSNEGLGESRSLTSCMMPQGNHETGPHKVVVSAAFTPRDCNCRRLQRLV